MSGMSTETRVKLEERIGTVHQDLLELADQARSGEIEAEAAVRLEATYRRELEQLESELAAEEKQALPGRSFARVAAGTLLFVGAAIGIVMLASRALTPGGALTASGIAAPSVDVESVSDEALEAVIAANAEHPQIAGMRLALADRYFQAGDFRSALPHYQAILDGDAQPADSAVALARIGWMFYQSGGEAATAAEYQRQSLLQVGDYSEAKLYLAMITLYGLGDSDSALPLLEELEARADLPPEIRSVVTEAIADARSAGP